MFLDRVTESFVNNKTNEKIKTLFDDYSDAGRKQITAVIGNVMEFRGVWKNSFSSTETALGEFQCESGAIINNVKMMCATDRCHVASTIEFEAIAKEFRSVNGEDLKLVAIIPSIRSATAINNLDSETINHLIGNLNEHQMELELKLPKLDVVDSCDSDLLKKISRALGISIEAEDLSRLGQLSRQELNIIQKIKTSIDEKGAQGAIATAAAIVLRECFIEPDEEEPIPYFHFDCPGYIAIVDSKGNRLLELIIKDGSFLILDGSPKITFAENC
ncbi:serpin family protein [Endozoicomonas sp. YOMI1]|uniref:serpin family protein n=1 Tax=Endozoicomonas sp. YOMI1 TaxID=2828739 RepID=UPI0021496124|nr:serpin family protein [Endozoicomonas sp. YOMI1]